MDGHRLHDPGSTSTTLSQAWHEHHRYLLDVAYRMLGSVSDAEDAVQEAFARLASVDLDRIEDPRAWLVVVVSRLCLDQLRSARSRHETYVGPWLSEPLIPQLGESRDPTERVTLDDSVRMALLVVLERLTPAERVAFVLHDVFQFSFDAVSSIVGRVRVARSLLQYLGAGHITLTPMPVNGQPGALTLHSGRVVAVFALTVRDGLVKHVHAIANPCKLAYVMSLLQPTNKPQGGRRVPSSTGKDAL